MKKNKNYEWKLELNRRKYISVRTEISNFFENPPIHEQQQLRVDKIVFQANDQAVERRFRRARLLSVSNYNTRMACLPFDK